MPADRNTDDLDPPLEHAVAWLREPVPFPADGGVAAALARLPRRRPGLTVVPGGSWLALAAGLGILAFWLTVGRGGTLAGAARPVQFAVELPAGAQVSLIGDFNDWNPEATPLSLERGRWSATVSLAPGRYRYSFVVDGRRLLADPNEPLADDEFGTPTSVITVPN